MPRGNIRPNRDVPNRPPFTQELPKNGGLLPGEKKPGGSSDDAFSDYWDRTPNKKQKKFPEPTIQ